MLLSIRTIFWYIEANNSFFYFLNNMRLVRFIIAMCLIILLSPSESLSFNVGGIPNTASGLTIFSLIDVLFKEIVWPIFVACDIIVFMFIGILFASSQGDSEKIAYARKIFIAALIGTLLALLSFSVPFIVRLILLFI